MTHVQIGFEEDDSVSMEAGRVMGTQAGSMDGLTQGRIREGGEQG